MTGQAVDDCFALAREIALRPRREWYDALAALPEHVRERVRAYLRGWEAVGRDLIAVPSGGAP